MYNAGTLPWESLELGAHRHQKSPLFFSKSGFLLPTEDSASLPALKLGSLQLVAGIKLKAYSSSHLSVKEVKLFMICDQFEKIYLCLISLYFSLSVERRANETWQWADHRFDLEDLTKSKGTFIFIFTSYLSLILERFRGKKCIFCR